MHDISNDCTKSSKYSNLFDALEIDHPVVANCLIDSKNIERTLLIPTFQEAHIIMADINKVPKNCEKAITKLAELIYPDPFYRSFGALLTEPKFLKSSLREAMYTLSLKA